MNYKLRVQLIIALIVIAVSSVFTFFYIANEERFSSERSERASENVKMAFDTIVKDVEHFYVFRAYANMRSNGIIDAMKEKDSQALYRLTLPRYKTLREENPYLIIMQFHAADGHSLIRMHRKEEYGDNIALKRPMLRSVHRTHRMISGFEWGVQGLAFRVIVPVIDRGVYLGAVEFGIDTKYFVDKIKKVTGSDNLLLLHENMLAAADKSRYKAGIGAYRFTSVSEEQWPIIYAYIAHDPSLAPKNIRYSRKNYEINPIFLKNGENQNIGVILCIEDVTGGYQNTIETLTGAIVLTLALVGLFWGLFEYAFGMLIGKVNLQERYIKTILDSQKNIVVVIEKNKIIYANQSFFDYFNYSNLKSFYAEHESVSDYFEKGNSGEYLQPLNEGLTWIEYLTYYHIKEHKVKMAVNGEISTFTVHAQTMIYKKQTRYVVVFTDITMLNELATNDILTHVANRFQFDKVLEHSISLSERYKRSMSIILIDIDHFKEVNDSYGHLVGDEILKKLALLLKGGIRKSDSVARWGGEEFTILLPDNELSSASNLAETLRKKIEESDFSPVERLTCSFGVVQWRKGEDGDSLMRRVDEKLYEAKEAGRNRVVS